MNLEELNRAMPLLCVNSTVSNKKVFLTSTTLNNKKKKLLTQKGFSLVELLIVVSIIGILAGIGVPSYQGYKDNAKNAAISATLDNLTVAYRACALLNDAFGTNSSGNSYLFHCPIRSDGRVGSIDNPNNVWSKINYDNTLFKIQLSSSNALNKRACFTVIELKNSQETKRGGAILFINEDVRARSTIKQIGNGKKPICSTASASGF